MEQLNLPRGSVGEVFFDRDELGDFFASPDADLFIILRYVFKIKFRGLLPRDTSDLFASLQHPSVCDPEQARALSVLQSYRNCLVHGSKDKIPSLVELEASVAQLRSWVEMLCITDAAAVNADGSHLFVQKFVRLLHEVVKRTRRTSALQTLVAATKSTVHSAPEIQTPSSGSSTPQQTCRVPAAVSTPVPPPYPKIPVPVSVPTRAWPLVKSYQQAPVPTPVLTAIGSVSNLQPTAPQSTQDPFKTDPKTANSAPERSCNFIKEGPLYSLRDSSREWLKGRRIVILDGKHAHRTGVFHSWSGTVAYVIFDDTQEKVGLNIGRSVGVFR